MQLRVQSDLDTAKRVNRKVKPIEILSQLWVDWLRANRGDVPASTYWLEKWGPFNLGRMRPDSSAAAATANPRLYVDSLLFYEDTAIRFVAEGMKDVKKALGQEVLCGANYSCHPFYYPHSTMYVKWFRAGASDLGRHSEYFWQVAQAGPMINGYIAEHFRAGLRDNPNGVLRQYTMPHSPGNTEANFLRSAFTHLAHGATMLDFFGIGMNETFTENHIDHRDRARYRALRDVTHAVGLVEDLLPKSRPVASPVALLLERQHRALGLRRRRRGFGGTRPVRCRFPQNAAQRAPGSPRYVDRPNLPGNIAGPHYGRRCQREGIEGLQGAGRGR